MKRVNKHTSIMKAFNKNQQRLILLLIAFLVASNVFAQGLWGSFSHSISDSGYGGLKFRYKAFVRSEIQDDDAAAHLWIRIDRNGERGFFNNMIENPIRSSEWKEYIIEGTIDEDYSEITFGMYSIYNGDFYFDDMILEIQGKDNQWRSIYKNDFENGSDDLQQGTGRINYGINKLFNGEVSDASAHSGDRSFRVSGRGVPIYGVNSKVGKYAKVNGIDLYYEIYGTGKPLVMLHANSGSISSAEENLPFFADYYQVIAVDMRAHGKSIDNETELTYELMASDISALLDVLKIDSTYVLGHSDGAIVAIFLALNHPDKIKKAVLISPNVVSDTTGIEAPAYNDMVETMKTLTDQKDKQLYTLMLEHPNIAFARLKAIDAEVLIVSGDRDVIPLPHTVAIFKNIPNSNLCVIPGTTFLAQWEKPELFQSIVLDFFNKPFSKPSTLDWYEK